MELKPCPFCGGRVQFHRHAEECPYGCHYLVCKGECGGFFDFSPAADPLNKCGELYELQGAIAEFWNRRAPTVTARHER
jgi:hypothetical protein